MSAGFGEDFFGGIHGDVEDAGDVFCFCGGDDVRADETVTDEVFGHFGVDAEASGEVGGGAVDAAFEFLVGAFVFFDLDVPAHEVFGEADVLAVAADGLGEVFFADADEDAAIDWVDGDFVVADLSGFEGVLEEGLGVIAPLDDIDLFVIEFADDVFDASAAHADAGADWVDLGVCGEDGDFGTVACFAGDGADFDGTVGDFADFAFEEAFDEVGVGAAEDDFGAAGAVFDGDDVEAEAVADGVVLGGDAFLFGDDAFEFAEVHDDVAFFEAADGAVDDIAGAVFKFLVDEFFFFLADALHHGLASGLGGDAAHVVRGDFDVDFVADGWFGGEFLFFGDFTSDGDADFLVGLGDFFDDEEFGDGFDGAFGWIDVDAEFACWTDDLAGGCEDGIGEGLHHFVAGDAFFSFVEIEDGQEFAGHKSGCGVKTKKRESLPAFLRMCTLMVFWCPSTRD